MGAQVEHVLMAWRTVQIFLGRYHGEKGINVEPVQVCSVYIHCSVLFGGWPWTHVEHIPSSKPFESVLGRDRGKKGTHVEHILSLRTTLSLSWPCRLPWTEWHWNIITSDPQWITYNSDRRNKSLRYKVGKVLKFGVKFEKQKIAPGAVAGEGA